MFNLGAILVPGSILIRVMVCDLDLPNQSKSAEESATSKRMCSNARDANQLEIARNSHLWGRDGGELSIQFPRCGFAEQGYNSACVRIRETRPVGLRGI